MYLFTISVDSWVFISYFRWPFKNTLFAALLFYLCPSGARSVGSIVPWHTPITVFSFWALPLILVSQTHLVCSLLQPLNKPFLQEFLFPSCNDIRSQGLCLGCSVLLCTGPLQVSLLKRGAHVWPGMSNSLVSVWSWLCTRSALTRTMLAPAWWQPQAKRAQHLAPPTPCLPPGSHCHEQSCWAWLSPAA